MHYEKITKWMLKDMQKKSDKSYKIVNSEVVSINGHNKKLMKLTKRNAKNLLIIVLCVFVLIPIIFLIFNLNPIEGYTNYTNNEVNNIRLATVPRIHVSTYRYL